MAQHEFAMTHYTLDRHSRQLQVLEGTKANKTVLLLDLPPLYNNKTLDNSIGFYLQAAGLSWDHIAALHNHMVTTSSSVVRVEFITESQANLFRETMRLGRRYSHRTVKFVWRNPIMLYWMF